MSKQAKQAIDLLNEFICDLITGARTIPIFESKAFRKPNDIIPHTARIRMCYSHLFLTLSKWVEFYKHFQSLIPSDCHRACKHLYNEIIKRKIIKFRNQRVGHIWDKGENRPWTNEETNTFFDLIVSDDPRAFLKWINDPKNNTFPNTVVSIVVETRDKMKQVFSTP
jgi:hypothetical protein